VLGDPRLAPYRLGQRSCTAVVLDAYGRRCAISGTHTPPVLQAADIRVVTARGEHRLGQWAAALISDIHTLFDLGYVGVVSHYRLLVCPCLRADFRTAISSTPRQARSSTYPNTLPTGPRESSSNDVSTKPSSGQLQPDRPRDSATAVGWLNGFTDLKDYLEELPHAWFLRDGRPISLP
jgi:hypothetical protein